jgi:anti-sigma factor RsiW
MSEVTPPIGEDDLHAYVDGQLPAGRRQAVEFYLQRSAEAARRVADYQAQREAIRPRSHPEQPHRCHRDCRSPASSRSAAAAAVYPGLSPRQSCFRSASAWVLAGSFIASRNQGGRSKPWHFWGRKR